MDYEERSRITVGELKEHLKLFSDDTEITFGGAWWKPDQPVSIVFYRTKSRGDKLVQIELNSINRKTGEPVIF